MLLNVIIKTLNNEVKFKSISLVFELYNFYLMYTYNIILLWTCILSIKLSNTYYTVQTKQYVYVLILKVNYFIIFYQL